jgi:hypothetical protein
MRYPVGDKALYCYISTVFAPATRLDFARPPLSSLPKHKHENSQPTKNNNVLDTFLLLNFFKEAFLNPSNRDDRGSICRAPRKGIIAISRLV